MTEYIAARSQAKKLFDKKEYEEALPVYEKIYSPECEKWIAWEYARSLKQLSRLDDALEISKALYLREKTFVYNNNLLSWLLYEKYFKEKKTEYTAAEATKLFDIAVYATGFTKQEKASAYEKIVIKTLKILKDLNSVPYDKILILLEKLDVSDLSDEAGKYEKGGKEKEYQSTKEMYYALKTKALLEAKEFKACIECCDEALGSIDSFHHNNSEWILSRKAASYAGLNDFNRAIELQNDVVVKKNHWSLFAGLAEIYLKMDDNKNALLNYCRAALTSDPPKMKVGLYFDIARLLIALDDNEIALRHLVFTKQIREQENWSIPFALTKSIEDITTGKIEANVKLCKLKDFWQKTIYDCLGAKNGQVSRLNAGGKTGFIQSGNKSYFFKTSSIMEKPTIKEGSNVSFVLIDSFDSKKNQKSTECAYIKIDIH